MVATEQSGQGCLICAKHRGQGPLLGPKVWEDEHALVSHRPVGQDGTTFLGYLFVESRRHVAYLDDLSDVEAEAIGRTVRRTALGLRTELNTDFVFSAIIGTGIAHFINTCSFAIPARPPGTVGGKASSGPTRHADGCRWSLICVGGCARTSKTKPLALTP
jgi:hypothetical protein